MWFLAPGNHSLRSVRHRPYRCSSQQAPIERVGHGKLWHSKHWHGKLCERLLQTRILLWSTPRRLAVWPSLSSWSSVLAPMAARDSSSPTIRRVASFVASVCGNRSERPICSMNSPRWPSLKQRKRRATTPMGSSKPRKRSKACSSSQPSAIARAIRSRSNDPARTSSS